MKKAKGVFIAALALAFVFALKPLADSQAYNASSYISGFNIGGVLVNNESSGTVNLQGATDFSAVPFDVKTSSIPRSLFAVHSDDNVVIQNAQVDISLSGSSGIAAVLSEGAVMYIRYGQQVLFSVQPLQVKIMRGGSYVDITNSGFSAADMASDSVQMSYNFSLTSYSLTNQNFNVIFSFSGTTSQTPQNNVSVNIGNFTVVANVTENSDVSQDILDVITTPPDNTDLNDNFNDSFGSLNNYLTNGSAQFFADINTAIVNFAQFTGVVGSEIGTFLTTVLDPFLSINFTVGNTSLNLGIFIISTSLIIFAIFIIRLILGLHKKDKGDGDD